MRMKAGLSPAPQTIGETAICDGDLFDLVQESLLILDLEGRITGWNAASERLYGWSKEDALGCLAHKLLPTASEGAPSLVEAQRDAGDWEGAVARTTAAGETVIVWVKWHTRRDPLGEPKDIFETGVNITAQHRAEEALARAEHRYDNVFGAMAVSFWELDFIAVRAMVQKLVETGVSDIGAYFASDREFVREMIRTTRIIDVNDQSVLLFGRGDKKELLTSLEPYWPEASIHVYAESVVAAYQRRPHYTTETRLRSIDGREFDTHFTACFPPEALARGRLLIGIIDISSAKKAKNDLGKSEQRYRNLFHFMPVSLIQLDRTELAGVFQFLHALGVRNLRHYFSTHPGFFEWAVESIKVIEVNHRTVALFGAKDAKQLLGPVARLWSESHEVIQQAMQARFNGAARFEAEMKIRAFDDSIRDVLYVADFPEAYQDNALGIACLIDITDRVRAQEMLAQVQAEFAHAARVSMLGELTASIAHEVNQPLGAILTNAEAALRWLNRPEPDVTELRALSSRTIVDARRAADIIRRVRAMAVRKAPELARTALNSVVNDVMLFLSAELHRQGIEATMDLAPGLPDIMADRVQLQQVLANLAMNAMQAMGQRAERRLTIRTLCLRPGVLCAEVEDTGPGIAPDHLTQLFQSFFTTKRDGMGIGLAICRSIIEAHGGSIEGESLPGSGARFRFTLPT
jgi:PAS domain S-box-containing protein